MSTVKTKRQCDMCITDLNFMDILGFISIPIIHNKTKDMKGVEDQFDICYPCLAKLRQLLNVEKMPDATKETTTKHDLLRVEIMTLRHTIEDLTDCLQRKKLRK